MELFVEARQKLLQALFRVPSFTSSSLFLEGANFLRRQAEPIAVSPEMEMPNVTGLTLKFVYGLSVTAIS